MSDVSLAELLLGLSAVADLGMGQPPGEAARAAVVALELARLSGSDENEAACVAHAALLQHVGCTAFSHEVSAMFADETVVKSAALETDFTRPAEIAMAYLPRVVRESPPGTRLQAVRSALLRSGEMTRGYQQANCEVASRVAARLGLPDSVSNGLLDIFEWWNGKGGPTGRRGEEISRVARLINLAGYAAVLFDRLGGVDGAIEALRQRAGGYLDPTLVETFVAGAGRLLEPTRDGAASEWLLNELPRPVTVLDDAELENALRVFGEAVDLKSPAFHGHCTAVASTADAASVALGLPDDERRTARLAALVADLGRVAVATTIWERHGALGSDDWMQVRLHPYHSEQILSRAGVPAIAAVVGAHHERLDGSGYYRGCGAAQLGRVARVVAVADSWCAMTSDRAHRPALSTAKSAASLRSQASAGRLDPSIVDAVIGSATGSPVHRPRRHDGLTDRQVEVLRLVAQGMSNREIAERLVISRRTAEHHVQDVYARIGVSSRAGAALYAMEHALLRDG
jgi:HD-GYP domain-containing protein (c-di-GMP phosphodiesterase class II)